MYRTSSFVYYTHQLFLISRFKCFSISSLPGTLPAVDGPTQFFTRSPGLDNSVRIQPTDLGTSIIICVVIIIIVIVILGFLYLTYTYIIKSNSAYSRMKKQEKPGRSVQMRQMPPKTDPPVSYQPQSNPYNPPQGSGGQSSSGYGQDNMYL